MLIPVEVVGVRIEMPSNQPIVLLKEIEGTRFLPIWVGAVEATAIAFAQQGLEASRPLTHDLFRSAFTSFGLDLTEVVIHSVVEGIYYCRLVVTNGVKVEEIDARPSDAIALAYRFDCPIYCEEAVLAEVGITPEDIEVDYNYDDDVADEDEESPAAKSLSDLQAELDDALDREDYERASQIRDEIERRKG